MSTEEGDRVELLQGTLDLLILQTLRQGAAHGHEIMHAIKQRSDAVLQVEQGSLYPALHRLIKRGWIGFDHGTSDNNRRAKYYALTAAGRRRLREETDSWNRLVGAMSLALKARPSEG
jgi:transcriptional regulator